MNASEWIDLDAALLYLEKVGVEINPSKEKLVKKIYSLINSGLLDKPFDINTIVTLDLDYFTQIKTIGISYVQSLDFLKNELFELNINSMDIFEGYGFQSLYCIVPELNKDLYLIHKGLSEKEIKLLNSLVKYLGEITVENLLKLEQTREHGLYKVTKNRLKAIKDLLNKISAEVTTKIKKGIGFIPGDSDLISSSDGLVINNLPIEDLLIEDIEDFIFNQDEKRQDVILSRTGYNHHLVTLEELGHVYDCTRENIRQIEKKVFQALKSSLRVHPTLIKKHVIKNFENEDLGLPVLSTFFDNRKLFFNFIEVIVGSDEGMNSEMFEPVTHKTILNDFFSLNAEPYMRSQLVNELMSSYGMHIVKASRTLDYLVEEGVVQNENEQYKPLNLGRKEAISQVLLNFPEGLPWKDVVNIVNAKGYTSSPMTLLRLDFGFTSSEYVYQYDHGTYRHTLYSSFEDFDIDSLLIKMKKFLNDLSSGAYHLMEFYSKEKESCAGLSYFDVRHLVREYGDLYGIYFNGKSNQDSISLDKEVKLGGQRNMIINALNQASGPLTKADITNLLRSKSEKHASFYINELIIDKSVVKIENMQYTTPEKAFKIINVQQVLDKMEDIIFSTDLPVEADVFRQRLNVEFEYSYSKYFYLSLAYVYLGELNAYKRRNFLSQSPISFDGLTDLSSQMCVSSLSYQENIRKLREHAVLTDVVAYNAVNRGVGLESTQNGVRSH